MKSFENLTRQIRQTMLPSRDGVFYITEALIRSWHDLSDPDIMFELELKGIVDPEQIKNVSGMKYFTREQYQAIVSEISRYAPIHKEIESLVLEHYFSRKKEVVAASHLPAVQTRQDDNHIQNFMFMNHEVRVIIIENEPWWVAKDICDILEHSNPSVAIGRLDEDERAKNSLGRQGDGWIITESGLFRLIMTSNKPEAKKFTKWVTSEVLPAIRKTGTYSAAGVQQFKVPQNFREALLLAAEQQEKIEIQQKQIEEAKPMVDFANKVTISKNDINIGVFAKLVGLGQNKLFEWMRKNDILMESNLPYQSKINAGYFTVRERVIEHRSTVSKHTIRVTVITGKGQLWLFKRLNDAGMIKLDHFPGSDPELFPGMN